MIFQIKIAEKNIRIHSIHDDVYRLCQDYLVHDDADAVDFEVEIREEDILYERKRCEEDPTQAQNASQYSDGYLETLAVYRKISVRFLEYDTFLMHGSVLAVGEKAYMFIAPSGTGKTTHTRLWLKHVPGATIVNGDKPLIMVRGEKIYACGTPWCGKEGYNRNQIVELKAIYLLGRGVENRICDVSFSSAFPVLLQQTYRPGEAAAMIKTLDLLKELKDRVHCYDMRCNRDPEAAIMAYEYSKRQETL